MRDLNLGDTGQSTCDHRHVRRVFHRLVQDGVFSTGEAIQEVLTHLSDVCLTCRGEISAWLSARELSQAGKRGVADFEAVRRGRIERAATLRDTRARRDVRRLLDRLFGESGPVRGADLSSVGESLATQLALVELSVERGRRLLHVSPVESFRWFGLACEVACQPVAELERHEDEDLWRLLERRLIAQKVRAFAYRGNSRRIQEDLVGAEADLARAGSMVRTEGITDLVVCAEVHGLTASLCRAQRRFQKAAGFIDSSLVLYRLSGQRLAALRSATTAATIYRAKEDVDTALKITRKARIELDELGGPRVDARLDLLLRHNEIFYLTDLEEYEEANSRLQVSRSTYKRFPEPWTQLRLKWVQGRIARGLGDLDGARSALSVARDGFIESGSSYDAALVSLELALVYLETGQTWLVQALAASMVQAFRKLAVRREALAAMRLFHMAALRDQVSEELTQRLLRYYSQAQFSPGRRLRDVR